MPRSTTKGVILKPYVSTANGYCYVTLSKNNRRTSKRIHSLVKNTFDPVNKKYGYDKEHTINHIDGDKTNNSLDNLEWATQRENQCHAYRLGLQTPSNGIEVINLDTLTVFGSFLEASRSVGGHMGELVRRVCDGERSHYRGARFARLSDYRNHTIPAYRGAFKKGVVKSVWQ